MRLQRIAQFLLLFAFIFSSLLPIYAQEELGLYEHLETYLPEDLEFINEQGETVKLYSLIDKPTVISLVYYECPGLCSPLLEGVADVITKAKLDLGTEYQFLTISFDPTEGTDLAVAKKATYSELVENKDVQNGWKWFTGDQENIDKLLNTLGYKIKEEGAGEAKRQNEERKTDKRRRRVKYEYKKQRQNGRDNENKTRERPNADQQGAPEAIDGMIR